MSVASFAFGMSCESLAKNVCCLMLLDVKKN